MTALARLFEQRFGVSPETVVALQGGLGGSGRAIFRLGAAGQTAIGIEHTVRAENVAFLNFSRHFLAMGLPVPEVLGEDLDNNAYLQQDLGDTTLYQLLQQHRTGQQISDTAIAAYRKAVALLPRFQVEGARGLDISVCYPRAEFDGQSIAWDLNYFKYYFLRLSGAPVDEQSLQHDFEQLTGYLTAIPRDTFLYRDFQSRNIMMVDGDPYGIDYQGGRMGAPHYDIASLLFDAKADLPHALRDQLLAEYLDALAQHTAVDREQFMERYYPFALIRILQALGAYGFRGYYERKPHFLASVPFALRNLGWLFANVSLPFPLPALRAALQPAIENAMAADETAAASVHSPGEHAAKLTVTVTSFSFHRGMPQDPSGHGGGFVFDARSLPNPGREEQYKTLTGRDSAVAAYLDMQPQTNEFYEHARALVLDSIAAYQRRGFTNLMVSFGCTGGQHRSVFLAERLAAALRALPAIDVVLQHRELDRMAAERTAL